MTDQSGDLAWREGGVPVSLRFDDPYYSLDGGMAETRHVFLAGNGLPARFRNGFRIAELGFGTGLNLLTTARAWAETGIPGTIHFTSFEAFPLPRDAAARALAAFPELAEWSDRLLSAWNDLGTGPADLGGVVLRVIQDDARSALPAWDDEADAWFLDGFAPARNPELWEPALLAQVARHTAPGGTAATYTAAGEVRRALARAGFAVERVSGYGRKRHMTRATLP